MRRNRTKRAHFRGSPLFQDTYNWTWQLTLFQIFCSVEICVVLCGLLSQRKLILYLHFCICSSTRYTSFQFGLIGCICYIARSYTLKKEQHNKRHLLLFFFCVCVFCFLSPLTIVRAKDAMATEPSKLIRKHELEFSCDPLCYGGTLTLSVYLLNNVSTFGAALV